MCRVINISPGGFVIESLYLVDRTQIFTLFDLQNLTPIVECTALVYFTVRMNAT